LDEAFADILICQRGGKNQASREKLGSCRTNGNKKKRGNVVSSLQKDTESASKNAICALDTGSKGKKKRKVRREGKPGIARGGEKKSREKRGGPGLVKKKKRTQKKERGGGGRKYTQKPGNGAVSHGGVTGLEKGVFRCWKKTTVERKAGGEGGKPPDMG